MQSKNQTKLIDAISRVFPDKKNLYTEVICLTCNKPYLKLTGMMNNEAYRNQKLCQICRFKKDKLVKYKKELFSKPLWGDEE